MPTSTQAASKKSDVTSHAPVIIYSVLAVVLIAYGIYAYFAMRNNYWPFQVYVLDAAKIGPDVVQPNGNVSYGNGKVYVDGKEDDDAVVSEDERDDLAANALSMQQTNCNWYNAKGGGKDTFPIPLDQKLIGDCGAPE